MHFSHELHRTVDATAHDDVSAIVDVFLSLCAVSRFLNQTCLLGQSCLFPTH